MKPFCENSIANVVERWMCDVHQILMETNMFVNFHVLRYLENNLHLPASHSDTFFYRAHAAVSYSMDVRCTFWHGSILASVTFA